MEIQEKLCTVRNFPVKSFYSPVLKKCLTFYRQGYCFMVNSKRTNETQIEKITDVDLGNMYLLYDQALIVRSSSSILFFKIDEETQKWTKYCEKKDMRGQIYFIRGNVRIQIITDEKIFFFLIDKQTFEPTLENVMNNYMNCSVMMFGPLVRFSITYKTN